MGKRSIKKDKNIYFQIREEEKHLTRSEAAELLDVTSESRLEKIEYGEVLPQPEDILAMANAYRHPELCNYYCTHECVIGKQTMKPIELRNLSEIILKMLASLNEIDSEKNRLIEITADGKISDDELHDFAKIQDRLEQISTAVESLKLWVNNTIAQGNIDEVKLEAARKKI